MTGTFKKIKAGILTLGHGADPDTTHKVDQDVIVERDGLPSNPVSLVFGDRCEIVGDPVTFIEAFSYYP